MGILLYWLEKNAIFFYELAYAIVNPVAMLKMASLQTPRMSS
jgi:hypothetical protein